PFSGAKESFTSLSSLKKYFISFPATLQLLSCIYKLNLGFFISSQLLLYIGKRLKSAANQCKKKRSKTQVFGSRLKPGGRPLLGQKETKESYIFHTFSIKKVIISDKILQINYYLCFDNPKSRKKRWQTANTNYLK
ncbi:MAG: hypothetical protein SNJ11_07700, partial [Rikenellaceae bacterium]